MKPKFIKIWNILWEPLIGASGIAPLGLLFYARFVPVLLPWAWAYPVLYGILLGVCQHVPQKNRRGSIITSMCLFLSIGVFLLFQETYFSVFIAPFGAAVLLLLQMLEAGSQIQTYLCTALHIIAQITLAVSRQANAPTYDPVSAGLSVYFFIFLFLSMLAMNRDNLPEISMGKHNIPVSIRIKHRIMTLALFFGTFLLALIPLIASGVLGLLRNLLLAFGKFMQFMMKLLSGGESETPEYTPEETLPVSPFPLGGAGITVNFENILVILLMIGLVVFLILFFTGGIRNLLKTLKEIWNRLNRPADSPDLGYEDEITALRPSSRKKTRNKSDKRNRNPSDKKLSPSQKIRYRYQKLLRKHRDWSPSTTAREKLPEDAAALYERSRYSSHAVTEEEAQEFIRKIRHK